MSYIIIALIIIMMVFIVVVGMSLVLAIVFRRCRRAVFMALLTSRKGKEPPHERSGHETLPH